jgi:hypothetical protein
MNFDLWCEICGGDHEGNDCYDLVISSKEPPTCNDLVKSSPELSPEAERIIKNLKLIELLIINNLTTNSETTDKFTLQVKKEKHATSQNCFKKASIGMHDQQRPKVRNKSYHDHKKFKNNKTKNKYFKIKPSKKFKQIIKYIEKLKFAPGKYKNRKIKKIRKSATGRGPPATPPWKLSRLKLF